MSGFGSELPNSIVHALINILGSDEQSAVKKQAASAVLCKLNQYDLMVGELTRLALRGSDNGKTWAKVTLGSLMPHEVNSRINNGQLATEIFPLQQLAPSVNWTKREKAQEAINFLSKQNVY